MSDLILDIEPIALTTSAANILNSLITSLSGPIGFTPPQPFLLIEHMRIINITASPIVVSLYKGATAGDAAGTEFGWNTYSLAANSAGSINYDDWWGSARFNSADFLTGIASALGVTLQVDAKLCWAS